MSLPGAEMLRISPARARIQRLLEAARELASPDTEAGRQVRARLLETTGLSRQAIELGLSEYLETHPSEEELGALCATVAPSPACHVLLSANVFIAAHRAIALALAASEQVFVRASRREPAFPEALARLTPGLFQLVPTLQPSPSESLMAYGRGETLATLRRELAPGVHFNGGGPGFGAAFLHESAADDQRWLQAYCCALARDVVAFDQRGCLSLRVVFLHGSGASRERLARRLGEQLALSLQQASIEVPLGQLTREELSEQRRFLDTVTYLGECIARPFGSVSVVPQWTNAWLPPVGRNVLIVLAGDLPEQLHQIAESITTFCLSQRGRPDFADAVRRALPFARQAKPGLLQKPPFDGPVDLRPDTLRSEPAVSPAS